MRSFSPVDTLTVVQSVAVLAPLGNRWPSLGGLLEEARLSLVGEAGLTARQVRDLSTACKRWGRLDPRLQGLYLAHTDHRAVQSGLWVILFGRGKEAPSGWVYGVLCRLWVDRYGYYPPIELVPQNLSP